MPTEHHVSMLLNALYNKLFCISAPFIEDIFEELKDKYDDIVLDTIFGNKESVISNLITKYISNMKDVDITKNINKGFTNLFLSKEIPIHIEAVKLITLSLIQYTKSRSILIEKTKLAKYLKAIDIATINEKEVNFLLELSEANQIFYDLISHNTELFNVLLKKIKSTSTNFIKFYSLLKYPSIDDIKEIIISTKIVNITNLFNFLHETHFVKLDTYIKWLLESIDPSKNMYQRANKTMDFIYENLGDISLKVLDDFFEGYLSNKQCTMREQHKVDVKRYREVLLTMDQCDTTFLNIHKFLRVA